MPFPTLLRDPRDRVPVMLSLLPPVAVLAWPGWVTVALGLWWLGNTVSHQAVHRRFFRAAALERAWSLWLSLLLGVPQRLWQQRHLAHHAERTWRWRRDAQLVQEGVVLLVVWCSFVLLAPRTCLAVYLPGVFAGLLLCVVHGYFEHRPGTTSIHAGWWNTLFLNDGYHVEHHASPARHWRDLPQCRNQAAPTSRLPPVLRWLQWSRSTSMLDAAERLVLRWSLLRCWVLAVHRRAFVATLATVPTPRRVVIIGGGLFPRSAILLRELLPAAEIVVLDAEREHLDAARPWLPPGIVLRHGRYEAGQRLDADLVVVPLALEGSRASCVTDPPAPILLVHDWLWQRRGEGCIVAWWLCKRLYVVRADARPGVQPVVQSA